MMKTNLLTTLASLALLWPLVTGCSEEEGVVGHDRGKVLPQVDFKSEPLTGSDTSKSRATVDQPITVDDLSLRLTSAEGDFTQTWTPASTFDSEREFPVGSYTLEAFYGTDTDEGYGKPYYYGKQELEVKTNRTSTVDMTVTLANSIVRIVFTDAFKEYMQAYSATVHSAGNPTPFAYDENSAQELYVRPGEIAIMLEITKPNGKSGQVEAARFTARPRYRHTVTVDVNEGNVGKLEGLTVSFDDTLDEKDVEIDISDDILSASAPVITLSGIEPGAELKNVETVKPAGQIAANIVARGKIASVMLTTSGRALLDAGFPAEVDLAAPTAEQKARMTELGFNTLGIWNKPDVMGVADFTRLIPNIPYDAANPTVTFSIYAKDRNGKVCDPVSFSVTVEQLRLAITEGFVVDEGKAELTLDYNGGSVSDAVFEAHNSRDTYTRLKVSSIEKNAATGLYKVTLENPAGDPVIVSSEATKVRVTINGKSAEGTISPMSMFIDGKTGVNAYAKRAVVTVGYADGTDLVGGTEFYVSTDGTNFSKVTSKQSARGRAYNTNVSFELTGLQPATTYTLYAQSGSDKTPRVKFTTEEAVQLYNAGMEEWHQTKSPHSQTTGFGMDSYRVFANAEGTSYWATRNELTTATSSGPTPYYVSYSGTRNVAGVSGQAAEISTLGYGEGSTFTGSGGSCKHRAAGMLFMGSHSASSETAETFDYGRPLASRPTAFSFQYKFASYNGESFKAYMVVENRENGTVELGRGELVSATDVSSFQQATVTINYTNTQLKATHAYIVFVSSTADSPQVKNVRGDKGAFGGFADSKRIGNVLTVDDINLIY